MIDRWRRVCEALGLTDGEAEYRKLIRAWSGWGRHYHTLDHLTACLQELDRSSLSAEHPAELELALWFHDAVYRTSRHDNESRSAAWATQFLASHGPRDGVAARVHDLVMATTHRTPVSRGDAALMVDIDLSILGQRDDIYDTFERNIRREYWWVPRRRYRAARIQILESFLSRETIYHHSDFQQRYEASARRNVTRAIVTLRSA